jgi:hypothetical protein
VREAVNHARSGRSPSSTSKVLNVERATAHGADHLPLDFLLSIGNTPINDRDADRKARWGAIDHELRLRMAADRRPGFMRADRHRLLAGDTSLERGRRGARSNRDWSLLRRLATARRVPTAARPAALPVES